MHAGNLESTGETQELAKNSIKLWKHWPISSVSARVPVGERHWGLRYCRIGQLTYSSFNLEFRNCRIFPTFF